MAEIVGFAEAFAGHWPRVAPVLDERAWRLLLGVGARQLGRDTDTYQRGVKITNKKMKAFEAGSPAMTCASTASGTTQSPRHRPKRDTPELAALISP